MAYVLPFFDMSPLSIRLREFREARAFTQAELAARAGVQRSTVNRIENGRATAIDLDVLDKLALALEVDPALLIVRTTKKRAPKRPGK